jgi:hypothetical protein
MDVYANLRIIASYDAQRIGVRQASTAVDTRAALAARPHHLGLIVQ